MTPTEDEIKAVKALNDRLDAMAFQTRSAYGDGLSGEALARKNIRLAPGVVIGGYCKTIQRQRGRRIERGRLMKVLDRCFAEQRVELTVRAYNKILTDLGFRLGNYTKEAKRNPT